MIFETHQPAAPYDDLIESIFYYKGFQPDHSIERVVPTGHVFILFELDGIERHTYSTESLKPIAACRQAWVSGLHHNHLSISAHNDSEMFVIQFKPLGAYPFLHQPMAEIANRVVPGDQFVSKEFFVTRDRLYSAPTSKDKFDVAEQWLRTHFDNSLLPPNSLNQVVQNMQAQPAAKLSEVSESFDGTQKHLISQFKKYLGITPKQYQRVLRFNDVFTQLQSDQDLSWADIAHRCGYSDQSHFIREFKNFSGFVPKSFLSEGFDEEASNFFPLDQNE